MRLWLGAAFAAVGIITALAFYFLVTNSGERVISNSSSDITVGRTFRLADTIGDVASSNEPSAISTNQSGSFQIWLYKVDHGKPVLNHGDAKLLPPPGPRNSVLRGALSGGRSVLDLPHHNTVVAAPFFRNGKLAGAVLTRGTRPAALKHSISALRGDSLTALALAILAGILLGFVVANLIVRRIDGLVAGAEEIAAGDFEAPLKGRGRDEIGELTRTLDSMRSSLRESFNVLTSERDKLSAIFDGLTDAVMVIGPDGEVLFSNVAAAPLLGPEGGPIDSLVPALRRAAEQGTFELDQFHVGDRVYALSARDIPADQTVLVVRDRTDELRRELAEREFVSNAAHELRNPIAGISGRDRGAALGRQGRPRGARPLPDRLSEDAERMSRLTQSLLTLARAETIETAEAEIVDVSLAAEEAAKEVQPVEGVELTLELEPDLAAQGDPLLLRQVLIGLLSNAFKNTPAPGAVRLTARRQGRGDVVIEVTDTGKGIPANELSRVFERFYRGSDTLEQEGFGLGLSIARRMVSVMGGQIGVRSRPGYGTTFWVKLPDAQITPTPVA